MPTGPPLHPCHILSNYLKQYGSYGLHKILDSGENYIMKTVRVVTLAPNIPSRPLLHFYQILSKYVLGYQSYGLHKISASGEKTTLRIKRELSLLNATSLLVLLSIPTKYYQIISNKMGVMASTRFRLQGRYYIRKTVNVVSLACDTPSGHPLHSYQTLPK